MQAPRVAVSPSGDEELVRIDRPVSLRWLARGLDVDGRISRRVALSAAGGTRVELDIESPRPDQPSSARVALGGQRRTTRPGEPLSHLSFDLCDRAGDVVSGSIDMVMAADLGGGQPSAGNVRKVTVTPCR
jgi:hypothetical protein